MAQFKRDTELVQSVENIISESTLDAESKQKLNSLLSRYKSNTFDEWDDRHKFYQRIVSDMVNDCGFRDNELAEKMANEHPTLQQNFMRLCVKFIKEMAKKSFYDGRNESSVKLAQTINESLDNDYLPFV